MTLFDMPVANGGAYPRARARASDPATAHLAAAVVNSGNTAQVEAIRAAVRWLGPSTAWQIAAEVRRIHGDRWQPDSIRTACARANLTKQPGGRSPGGRPAVLYDLA